MICYMTGTRDFRLLHIVFLKLISIPTKQCFMKNMHHCSHDPIQALGQNVVPRNLNWNDVAPLCERLSSGT